MPTTVRALYADGTQYRSRLVDAVRDLTAESWPSGPARTTIRSGRWPPTAPALACSGCAASSVSLARTPRRSPTPCPGSAGRTSRPSAVAAELVIALETTGAIIERCLDTWTVDMLEVEFERGSGDSSRMHTRRSVLLRLLSHDAFHSGEISQLLGATAFRRSISGRARRANTSIRDETASCNSVCHTLLCATWTSTTS